MVQESVVLADSGEPVQFLFREVLLQPGLSVGLTRCQSDVKGPVSFAGDNSHLHFNCLLEGRFDARVGDCPLQLGKGVLNRGFAAGETFELPHCQPFTNLEVMIEPKLLATLAGGDDQLTRLCDTPDLFMQQQQSCRRSSAAAAQIASLLDNSPEQSLLIHSATLEYLHWHLQAFVPQQKDERVSLRERRQLQQARELLLQDLANAPTIAELSRAVGLNQFRLKQAFRQLYGNSIYATFQQERMQSAMELLQQYNVTETAMLLGYSNASHFSAAFRKQFGLSPRDARHERQTMVVST